MEIVVFTLLILTYLALGIFCAILMILPIIIAYKRKHNNFMGILFLTTLGALTIILWVVALVWAFSSNVTDTLTSKLNELEDLKNKGIINQSEYDTQRRLLLGK